MVAESISKQIAIMNVDCICDREIEKCKTKKEECFSTGYSEDDEIVKRLSIQMDILLKIKNFIIAGC